MIEPDDSQGNSRRVEESEMPDLNESQRGGSGHPSPVGSGDSVAVRWEPPSPKELEAVLSGYEIIKMLGRGGMGAVYMGRQKSLDRTVAIKILSSELEEADAGFSERFENEARAMAKLNHPGIVQVYDFGQTGSGLLYIVMEYVDGTDVARMIAVEGRLQTEHAMAIAAHVCDALNYAHERGIIHRDIKPANIMVGYDGMVKVADFGLAKAHSVDTESIGLTQSGMVMGTMHYIAPEMMVMGSRDVDQRVDVYAVGVMLYHMLVGKVPHGMFELPSVQVQGLDPRYDEIVAKAMREDREQRFQDARELRGDLDAILTQPVAYLEAAEDGGDADIPVALPTQARPKRPEGVRNDPVVVRAEGRESFRRKQAKLTSKWIWLAAVVGIVLLVGILWRIGKERSSPVEPILSDRNPITIPEIDSSDETSAESSPAIPPTTVDSGLTENPTEISRTQGSDTAQLTSDWVDLFNGRDLVGWEERGGVAEFKVENGAIVGRSVSGSGNAFLCTTKSYSDFELEFEAKVDAPLNSGVQIRSGTRQQDGAELVHGPQFDLEDDPGFSGFLYGERTKPGKKTGDFLFPNSKGLWEAREHDLWKGGEWNHCRITAVGDRIQTWVNEEAVSDFTNSGWYARYPEGFIGLQVHSVNEGEGPWEAAWRNIRIREMNIGAPDGVGFSSEKDEEWINLLSSIDPSTVTFGTAVRLLSGDLKILPNEGKMNRASIPIPNPETNNYEVEFAFTLNSGNRLAQVGVSFPAGTGGQATWLLNKRYTDDLDTGERYGAIEAVEGLSASNLENQTRYFPNGIVRGKRHIAKLRVEEISSGEVRIQNWIDGEKKVFWEGPAANLSLTAKDWAGLDRDRIWIGRFGNQCEFFLHEVRFRSLDSVESATSEFDWSQSILGEWWQRVESGNDEAYRVKVSEKGGCTLETSSKRLEGTWKLEDAELVFEWENGVNCRFPITDEHSRSELIHGSLEVSGREAMKVQLSRGSRTQRPPLNFGSAQDEATFLGKWSRSNMDRPGSAYEMQLFADGSARWEGDEGVVRGNWKTKASLIEISWNSDFDFVLKIPDDTNPDVLEGRAEWPDGKTTSIVYRRMDSRSAISLFDGESLAGWKILGNQSSFAVENGMIKATSVPGNLIYIGKGMEEPVFTDFDLSMKVLVETKGNSGVWIHVGDASQRMKLSALEVQICNNQPDDKRTGALWGVHPARGPAVADGVWFEFRVRVMGETVTTFIDGQEVAKWTQPDDWTPPQNFPNAALGKGTFGLQGHRGGVVRFKDIFLTLP